MHIPLLIAPMIAAIVTFFSTIIVTLTFAKLQQCRSSVINKSLPQIDWPTIIGQHIHAIDIAPYLEELAEQHLKKSIISLQQKIPFTASLIKGPIIDTIKDIVKDELIHIEPTFKEYMTTVLCNYFQEDTTKKTLYFALINSLLDASGAKKLLLIFAALVSFVVFLASFFMVLAMAL